MFTDNFQEDTEFLESQIVLTLENEKVKQKFRFPAQIKQAEYNAAYRALGVQTRWLKGRYPGLPT